MNQLFKAGQTLGLALAPLWHARDVRGHVAQAANEIERAGWPGLEAVIARMRTFPGTPGLAQNAAFTEIVGLLRDQHLAPTSNGFGYQAFCAGYTLGELEDGLADETQNREVSEAKRAEALERLDRACRHAMALQDQCGVAGMRRFEGQYHALTGPLSVARHTGDLRNLVGLVHTLAAQVGTTIPVTAPR